VTRFAGKRALITGAGSGIGVDVVAADIAATDVHLDVRSDAASFVTGRVLVIDGGLTDA
jgi:NAD(P)-dependent dehydrogenase (short-subunit alcohol dehydrogenase family)